MDLQLKDKSVLVAGGSKGIGLEIALTLAAEGANVSICARNQAEVDAAVKRLGEQSVKAYGEVVDVTDAEALARWVENSSRELGGVDGLVASPSAGGADVAESGWRQNFEVDMLAVWKLVNAALPYLEKSSCGSIVTISSTAALETFAGASPYGAMKAALINYSGNLAHDLAPKGIRVNCVSPGPIFIKDGAWDQIKQAMPEIYEGTVAKIPFGRMGSGAEVASQVVLLLSPRSGFTSGANIVIDGCFTQGLHF